MAKLVDGVSLPEISRTVGRGSKMTSDTTVQVWVETEVEAEVEEQESSKEVRSENGQGNQMHFQDGNSQYSRHIYPEGWLISMVKA